MNYMTEDLAKIKQLVATTDMNNVRVGIQIAKGLGVSAETLASLFTIDDVVDYNKYGPNYFKLVAFGHVNEGRTKYITFEMYSKFYIYDIQDLLNE